MSRRDMPIAIRVLVLADYDSEIRWLSSTLGSDQYAADFVFAPDEASARASLSLESWSAIVCSFSDGQPPRALEALRQASIEIDAPLLFVGDRLEQIVEEAQRFGAIVCLRSRGIAHIGPALAHAVRQSKRRRARAQTAAFEAGQRTVLEHIAGGKPLQVVLEEIVLLIEQQGKGMLCSILLLDADARCVRHGAAPHLPRALVEGVNGAAIGPHEGSCGAAAYLGEVVTVDDIGTHPNWVRYQHLALPYGLRACWSSPIFAAPGGDVLGTFAMYYRDARAPTDLEREWVGRATHLAAIALSRDRGERAVRDANARYRQIVDTAYEGIWVIDVDGRTLFVNQRTAMLLGYGEHELLARRIVDFMDEPSRRAAEGTFLERLRRTSEQGEFRFQRKDGALFWALVSGSPIQNDHGEAVGALGMITDISELKRTEEALRQSEAEFRTVFENAAIGMALLSEQGQIQRSNPALQRFLGYTEVELCGRRLDEFAPQDDRRSGGDSCEMAARHERETFRGERRYLRKDGQVVWGRTVASQVRPSQRVPLSIIVMIENVSERRQLEEAVRSSERLRSLMYGAVTDILFYLGVEPGSSYRFLSVNPAFLRATGLTEAEVIGRSVHEVIPEPSRRLVLQHYATAIEHGRTVSWDEVTNYPSGKKYGEVSITPIFDASGTCTNLVGTVHDVTERKLAEERLAAQAALLDKAKDAILVRSIEGRIEYWNMGAERLYGWSRDEAIGRDVRSLFYRETTAFEKAEQQLVETGQWSGELLQFTKTGTPITVEGSWTLLLDEDDNPRAVLAINTDITEKKSLEAQVFHAQRLESLGQLAGGIAHDFNNLLAAILGNVAFGKEQVAEGDAAWETLSEIERASQRGTDLVRRLLTFSRRQDSHREVTALVPIVKEALQLLRVGIPRNVRVETHFTADVPEIVADPTQVHQVVMNLVKNAVQAIGDAPGGLEVRVERTVLTAELEAGGAVLRPGTYARLTFTDTGSGMDETTLGRIFAPFFTTKRAEEGSGLGLSVVRGIVRNHAGGIRVTSTLGRGSEFTIYLPAAAVANGA